MTQLMINISLACLMFSEWSGVIQWIKWYSLWDGRLKPFDCAMCMSFWVSLVLFLTLNYSYWSILYAFANAGITVLINAIYERITAR